MNLARQHFRRRKVRKESPLHEGEQVAAEDEALPLERSEEAARVRKALAQLPDSQREVVVLHWFDEMSFAEVAHLLLLRCANSDLTHCFAGHVSVGLGTLALALVASPRSAR